jgi:hypothetical protein
MLSDKQEAAMTVADDILHEVRRKAGRTEEELAALIFGRDNAYQQRVNSTCRRLIEEGKIVRRGKGGQVDPFTYHLPPIRRRI